MFRRTFWFTAGAAAGVWATQKVNRKIKALTPESLAAQAADKAVEAGHRLRDFALDVRAGMVQREAELGDALGLDTAPDDARALGPQRYVAAIDQPSRHTEPSHHTTNSPPERGNSSHRNEDH